ncbi:glycoprotein [Serratia fonticola]|uniref:glycoprotein n=1 Tax=Serratia fonticola TaxID=47917 RepID=UPI003AAA285F
MSKYEVVRPWIGVAQGDTVEFETLHPSLVPNVRPLRGESAGELSPATPEATSGKRGRQKAEAEE